MIRAEIPAGQIDRERTTENRPAVARTSLPQLPDTEIDDLYERLRLAERRLATLDGTLESYGDGVATYPDELHIARGAGALLVTTEHATHQRRRLHGTPGRRLKQAEPGTAALGALLHEDVGATHITPLGRQTGDPNDDAEHPLKQAMLPVLESGVAAHFSLHGMAAGRIAAPTDTRGYDILLGIGAEPSDETSALAARLQEVAGRYDMRLGINQPVLRFDSDGQLRRGADGALQTITFAARGEHTTRAYAQRTAKALGRTLAAIQFELSPPYRFPPLEQEKAADRGQRVGVYLGYVFLRDSALLAAQL